MDTKYYYNFTGRKPRGDDFIRGGPVIAESWRYDSCRYLTTPLGLSYIYLHRDPAQSRLSGRDAQSHRLLEQQVTSYLSNSQENSVQVSYDPFHYEQGQSLNFNILKYRAKGAAKDLSLHFLGKGLKELGVLFLYGRMDLAK